MFHATPSYKEGTMLHWARKGCISMIYAINRKFKWSSHSIVKFSPALLGMDVVVGRELLTSRTAPESLHDIARQGLALQLHFVISLNHVPK
jgi:hypothetical protein